MQTWVVLFFQTLYWSTTITNFNPYAWQENGVSNVDLKNGLAAGLVHNNILWAERKSIAINIIV